MKHLLVLLLGAVLVLHPLEANATLSRGEKIGIGVGVGIGGLLVIGGIVVLILLNRGFSRRMTLGPAPEEPRFVGSSADAERLERWRWHALFFESVLDAQQGSVFAPRRVVAVSSVFTPRGLFQHRRRFARDMSVADRDGTLVRSSPLGVTRPRPGTRYELAFKP